MAGLLTARALSDHYAHVTLIERDTLPDEAEYRAGTPQARHVHALLARGQSIMEAFFPGLTQCLTDEGSPRMDWGHDMKLFLAGRWQQPYDDALVTNLITRTDLEWQIRQRVTRLPNVTFLAQMEVDGLLADPTRTTVTGVRLKSRVDHTYRELIADLVVDASGRRSQAPEWLTALGYNAAEETLINSFLGYASRWYEMKQGTIMDRKAILITVDAAHGQLRGAASGQVGNNRWLITLVGMNKDYPPIDEDGFYSFMKSLPSPDIYESIRDAKPLSPIYGYRYEGSRRRHYEKLARRPENFILVGDAVCSFNPVYGQGMTVAAIEAERLTHMLTEHNTTDLTGFATKFQKAMLSASADAWLMATGEDLRYAGTEGTRPGAIVRLIQRYTDQVFEGATVDPYLARRFNRVMNLIESPTACFQPKMIWHTLRYIQSKSRVAPTRTASQASLS